MKNKMSFFGFLSVGLFALLTSSTALACPDCPFPMKIGENQWLMPNSNVVLNLEESRYNSTQMQTRVALYDRVSGKALANGSGLRRNDQRQLKILLWDAADRRISGIIYWVNPSRSVIKAKFSCLDEGCAIASEL